MNKLKNLLIVNGIGLVLLILVLLLLLKINPIVGIAGLIIWVAYVIYGNYTYLLKKEDKFMAMKNSIAQMDKADRRNEFDKEIQQMSHQIKSLEVRAKIMESPDTEDIVRDKYLSICEKVEKNLAIAEKFMETYDYVMRPSKQKLVQLVWENNTMIQKLNELVDAMLSIDMSINDVDMSDIDDIINGIKQITTEEM